MNEKIKELYNKAWLKVDPSNPQETFTNAFAELIIKECAEIARVFSVEGVEYDGGDAIREHFGVEL
jgi:hypothetical protein